MTRFFGSKVEVHFLRVSAVRGLSQVELVPQVMVFGIDDIASLGSKDAGVRCTRTKRLQNR